MSLADQLTGVRAEINEAEQKLSDLQIKLIDLRVEAAAFAAVFEQKVWPYQKELQEIRQQIDSVRGYTDKVNIPGLPDDYVPAGQQFARAFRPTGLHKLSGDFKPKGEAAGTDDVNVKRVYRRLALRFHPDLAPSEATRQRWTEYMGKINDAYAASDVAALKGLESAFNSEFPLESGNTTETGLALVPDQDELMQAQNRLQMVESTMRSVEAEVFELEWGWELKLKRDAQKASAAGRDMLAEMVNDLQKELDKSKRELARWTT